MLSDEKSSRKKQVKTYPNKDQFRCLSVSHCPNSVNIYMDKLLVLCIVQYCSLNISFYVYMKCTYFDNQWFFNKYMFLKYYTFRFLPYHTNSFVTRCGKMNAHIYLYLWSVYSYHCCSLFPFQAALPLL